MIFKNTIKTLALRINKKNFSAGKSKYSLTLRDFLVKLAQSKHEFDIEVVLCGYPRSGTHWIRNVISKSLDKYCPSMDDIDYLTVRKQKNEKRQTLNTRNKSITKRGTTNNNNDKEQLYHEK